MIPRVLRLFSLLPRNPKEFCQRVIQSTGRHWESAVLSRPPYQPSSEGYVLDSLGQTLRADLHAKLQEPELTDIENKVKEIIEGLSEEAFSHIAYNGGKVLARFCYAVARSLRPRVIVETGVYLGLTSAYLLEALEVAGEGCLQSVDLPPLDKNADDYVGLLVPEELRKRWTLHRGTSRKLLPPLLAKLGEIDLFIHDSSHTYRNMRREFRAVWPYLRRGGALISDDVDGNRAFQELMAMPDVACSFVLREERKNSLVGVAVKASC